MSKRVIVLGCGGHAKVVADIVVKTGDTLVGFLDDDESLLGEIIYQDKKVIGKISDCSKFQDTFFVIGIGSNIIREKIAKMYDLAWYTAIHPSASIANDVIINEGSVVMAQCVINPKTVIGKHAIINTKASLDHDNFIGDFVHISPGVTLCGTVTVLDKTWVGAGSTVINNIIIGKNNIIGAGSLVIKNIEKENKVFVGSPVRELVK